MPSKSNYVALFLFCFATPLLTPGQTPQQQTPEKPPAAKSDASHAQPLSAPTHVPFISAAFLDSIRDLPDSSNDDANHSVTEAWRAFGDDDLDSAISALRRALAADPKFVRAWVILGEFLLTEHQMDSGMDAYQKAITVNPNDPITRRLYAFALSDRSKFAEAASMWQAYTKLAPEDPDGFDRLGLTLIELKRYDDAVQALQMAVQLNPDMVDYQSHLATACFYSGKSEKADVAYEKIVGLNPPSTMLNRMAYDLTLGENTPPFAVDFAQKAVHSLEQDSMSIDLTTYPRGFETGPVLKLAAYWATLGRVQQRLGKLDDAEKNLLAAWELTQNGVAAAHLCELYLDQHKNQSALQMCRFARSRLPMEQDMSTYHTAELIQANKVRLEKLSPGSSKTYHMQTIDQLAAMRDFKLPRVLVATATAEFLVLFEYDPQTGCFKVVDSKYVSGSEKLKSAGKALAKLNPNFTSPDNNPVRVLRHGTVICGDTTGCEFMLPDATAGVTITLPVHPVD
ncbi:MAG TPA: tetratricopeptide repeat protein [Candidatus Eremiobacteraceae bacterium]|nr:tetratricopeptide repeat protein [Candidatus Eremiobacteraceae bacterium]